MYGAPSEHYLNAEALRLRAVGSPAVIVADIAGPGQAPARVALGRTQVTQVAAPYQYICNASGNVVTVARKRDR